MTMTRKPPPPPPSTGDDERANSGAHHHHTHECMHGHKHIYVCIWVFRIICTYAFTDETHRDATREIQRTRRVVVTMPIFAYRASTQWRQNSDQRSERERHSRWPLTFGPMITTFFQPYFSCSSGLCSVLGAPYARAAGWALQAIDVHVVRC